MKILTVGEQQAVETQTTSIATRVDAAVDSSLVNVLIEYPEDYKGQRHHIDGKVYPMSKETAEIAIAKGIGSIEVSTEPGASTEGADLKSDAAKKGKRKTN